VSAALVILDQYGTSQLTERILTAAAGPYDVEDLLGPRDQDHVEERRLAAARLPLEDEERLAAEAPPAGLRVWIAGVELLRILDVVGHGPAEDSRAIGQRVRWRDEEPGHAIRDLRVPDHDQGDDAQPDDNGLRKEVRLSRPHGD